jgi:superfamily II DNA or RNA helicase
LAGRNTVILNIVRALLHEGRHVIVLSHRRVHAQYLFDNLNFDDKILIRGSDQLEDDEHHQLVVATFQYIRVAFNMPRLDAIVNTGPYTAFNDVKQSTGRIMRSFDGKPTPLVVDVYEKDSTRSDSGRRRSGPCRSMFKKRLAHYEKLGYHIENEECQTIAQLLEALK